MADFSAQEAEARLLEPDKCEAWMWAPWREIPQPIFLPLKILLDGEYDPFKEQSR